MNGKKSECRYYKGKDIKLDKEYSDYQKLRIWAGKAWTKVLDDTEVDLLAELWGKQKLAPHKMTFHEVETLVAWFLFFCRGSGYKKKSILKLSMFLNIFHTP